LSIARRVANRILTLPIYDSLETSHADVICTIIEHLHGRRSNACYTV
jgi:dTDP-4-amino-4,6-dideoxygalactose transaminase